MHIAHSDKPIMSYSLDVIISVGYRVKSIQGTQFRIWANKILKEYLVKGYVVNEKIKLQQYGDFKQIVKHRIDRLSKALRKYTSRAVLTDSPFCHRPVRYFV